MVTARLAHCHALLPESRNQRSATRTCLPAILDVVAARRRVQAPAIPADAADAITISLAGAAHPALPVADLPAIYIPLIVIPDPVGAGCGLPADAA